MKKRVLSLLLVLAMLLQLTACGTKAVDETTSAPAKEQLTTADLAAETQSEEETTEAETQTPREDFVFTDDCGREVTIPGEVSRVVPSGPLAQIILFAITPEMFVGLAAEWYDSAEGIIPSEYMDLPYFGQLYGSANLNVEELALADPQLIVDIGEAKSSIVEDLDTLQSQTNIPTVYVSATLETMPQTYRTLGKILGKEEKGEELAQFCEKIYSRTISIMEQVGDNKVKGLYVLGEEGLNVLANSSYHAELIDMLMDNLAVVDNPAGKGTGNSVDMEQIAIWNPDFIAFAPGSIYSTVAENATWKEISAIANNNYVEVPDAPHNWLGTPPAVQRYLGMIWLTAVLYPEYCDYDVKAEVMEYYRLFYGCELTDAQYEEITANAFLAE